MIYLIPRTLEPDYPLIPALVVVEEFIDTVYRTTSVTTHNNTPLYSIMSAGINRLPVLIYAAKGYLFPLFYFLSAISLHIGLPISENFFSYSVMTLPSLSRASL